MKHSLPMSFSLAVGLVFVMSLYPGNINAQTTADLADLHEGGVQDIYFAEDSSDLSADARDSLNRFAEMLKANPAVQVLIEGHTNEIGTDEYNLGLGERRALRTRDYLDQLGVASSRLKTISYGETQPKCSPYDSDTCLAENRRVHFLLSR